MFKWACLERALHCLRYYSLIDIFSLMQQIRFTKLVQYAVVLLSFVPAFAQATPDAGQLINQQLQAPPQPSRSQDMLFPSLNSSVMSAPGGLQTEVRSLEFVGNETLDAVTLQTCLGPDVLGQWYDLAGLQGLADQLSTCYRVRGYPFARAFVPAQQMQDGVLRLQLVEGRYGRITVNEPEASRFFSKLYPGAPIETGSLERAALLLADMPGVYVKQVFQPGGQEGTGDLLVEVQRKRDIYGKVGLDNGGSPYTGSQRLRLDASLGSAWMLGDQLTLNATTSSGHMFFGKLDYAFPLDGQGLRGQLLTARSEYRLGGSFASANTRGTADVWSAGLAQSLQRSRAANISLAVQLQKKFMHDTSEAGSSDHVKRSQLLQVNLTFDQRDQESSESMNYGSLSLVSGRLSLDEGLLATDMMSARASGNFSKLGLDIARQQRVGHSGASRLTAYARLVGQWTPTNLDSSEKFSLGGATGVRAYPVGEGVGDRGWMAQVELRGDWQSFSPYMFVDAGRVQINAKPWSSGESRRSLTGAGMGLRAEQGPVVADLAVAWRIQGGRSQSDELSGKSRVWLNVTARF
jgi:hemolysin activation/secretion protein